MRTNLKIILKILLYKRWNKFSKRNVRRKIKKRKTPEEKKHYDRIKYYKTSNKETVEGDGDTAIISRYR